MIARTSDDDHRWYVLRVWFERDGARRVWRASVRRDDQHVYFSSPDALMAYLMTTVGTDEESA